MRNTLLFVIIIIILLVIGALFINYVKESESQTLPQELTAAPQVHEYYWSESCPHCTNVSEFLEGWEGKEKVGIEKYEVNESLQNAEKFIARGKYCKIPRGKTPVPLLITPDGDCWAGDEDIINYFKNLEL